MRFFKFFPAALATALFACGSDPQPQPMPNPALAISTATLPNGQVGVEYSARVEATGGSGAGYRWKIFANSLPAGTTIAAEGTPSTAISGVPSESGAIGFTVEVTDSAGATAKKDLRIQVNEALRPLAIETVALSDAAEREPYEATITAHDGSGENYRWELVSGALPDGLTLSPEGTPSATLSGTPAESGTFSFAVRVVDSASSFAERIFTLDVAPYVPPPLVIETALLPNGTATRPYAESITARGGSGSGYRWTIARGGLPGGLTLEAEGTPATTLSGTPRLDGNFRFTVAVTDSEGTTTELEYMITIAPAPPLLDIIIRPLPAGIETQAYSTEIRATGGSEMDYVWSVAAGALPPGLTIAASGTPGTLISGVPTAAGAYEFTLSVRDSFGSEDQGVLTIVIDPLIIPIAIETISVPGGAVGVAYETSLATTPGTGTGVNYNWVVTAGALPPGLTLQQNSTPNTRISGTPTAGGEFTATISVFDSNNDTASQTYTFDIYVPLTITTAALPVGQQNSVYSATLTALGGSESDYTWSIVQGRLPGGLVLAPSGTPSTELTGTSTEAGVFNFTVEARDDAGGIAARSYSLTMVAGLTINLAALPAGRLGQPYNATISAVGGSSAGYSWSLTSGALPAGLTLAASGTPSTTITGTPTSFGVFNFTVRVTDSGNSQTSGDFSIEVASADRWYAFIGDARIDAVNEVFIAGIPGLAPPSVIVLNPVISGAAASTNELHNQFSPDGTKIAFRGDFRIDGTNELFISDLIGSVPGTPVLVNAPMVTGGAVIDFVWAPDSSRLIYSADQEVNDRNELYYVDLSGAVPSTPVKLNSSFIAAGDVSAGDFNFSPDGATVAYRADAAIDEMYELFVVDVAGAVPGPAMQVNTALPTGADVDVRWVWSPDGTRIIYEAAQDVAAEIELFVVDISSGVPSAPLQVSGQMGTGGNVGTTATDVALSADGAWVAYVADQDTNGVEEIYVVDISGALPGPSIKVSGPAQSFTDNINLKWSPTATRLVYSSDQETTSVYEVYLVDFAAGAPVPAVKIHPTFPSFGRLAAGAEAMVWSSDGSKVAYRADTTVDNAFEIEVIDLSGPTPAAPIDAVPPRVVNGTTDAFEFAPDGSAIAARGENSVNNDLDEVFVTRFSGPNANVPVSITGVPPGVAGAVLDFAWLGDSRHVLVRGDLFVDGVNEVFLIDSTAPVFPPVSLVPGMPAAGDVATLIVRRD